MRGMYNGTEIGLYIYVLYGTNMCAYPSESAHDNLSAHHDMSANHNTIAHHNTIAYYNKRPRACPSTSMFPIAIALPSWVWSVTDRVVLVEAPAGDSSDSAVARVGSGDSLSPICLRLRL